MTINAFHARRGTPRKTIGGLLLTDHDLIAACTPTRVRQYEETGRRTYAALFGDQNGVVLSRTFAVGHAEAAATYAREYAARILGGSYRILSVRWAR